MPAATVGPVAAATAAAAAATTSSGASSSTSDETGSGVGSGSGNGSRAGPAAVRAAEEGAARLEDLDEPPEEPRLRGATGRTGLMKPLVVLALPGMYLFYKYSQYRREQRELSRRRVTERELQQLHHKIDKLLTKLEENEPEMASSQEDEILIGSVDFISDPVHCQRHSTFDFRGIMKHLLALLLITTLLAISIAHQDHDHDSEGDKDDCESSSSSCDDESSEELSDETSNETETKREINQLRSVPPQMASQSRQARHTMITTTAAPTNR